MLVDAWDQFKRASGWRARLADLDQEKGGRALCLDVDARRSDEETTRLARLSEHGLMQLDQLFQPAVSFALLASTARETGRVPVVLILRLPDGHAQGSSFAMVVSEPVES